ncbi:MAG TPA: coproporphyrinogen III oxidase, partial [Gemmatales bacterium]|nr:coproporphyrinogen III oxidase [Gemmatales bacterium]
DEERLIRELVLQLKTGRVDKDYFHRKFGIHISDRFAEPIATLSQQGLMEHRNGTLAVTRQGLLVIDKELPAFFLPRHRGVRYT